jgi:hypothetical protein
MPRASDVWLSGFEFAKAQILFEAACNDEVWLVDKEIEQLGEKEWIAESVGKEPS